MGCTYFDITILWSLDMMWGIDIKIWKDLRHKIIGNKNTRSYEHPFKRIGILKTWMDKVHKMSIIVDCQGIMFAWYQLHTLKHFTNIYSTTILWTYAILTLCNMNERSMPFPNPPLNATINNQPVLSGNYMNNTHATSLFQCFECIGGYQILGFSLNTITH